MRMSKQSILGRKGIDSMKPKKSCKKKGGKK